MSFAQAQESSADDTFGKVLAALVQKRLEAAKVARDGKSRAVHAAMIAFYAEQGTPVWMDKSGLNEKGQVAVKTLKKAGKYGLEASDYVLPTLAENSATQDLDGQVDIEIRLTKAVLKYMRDARGGRINPSSLTIFLDLKPDLGDPAVDLGKLVAARGEEVGRLMKAAHPRHPQFRRLAVVLGKLRRSGASSKEIIRVLLNMERYRYLPRRLANRQNIFVYNNIPELKSRIIKNGDVIFEEKMIVGKVSKKTPVFSDQMEWIEIHPTWYIPNSIKKNDIYPRIRRGSRRILDRFNIKLNCGVHGSDPAKIDWSKVKITSCSVTQPPSRLNVLGFFKFKFPNKHSVYMHDTDEPHLFKRKRRLLSHGCMRIQNPQRMAALLLQPEGISPQRISKIVKGPRRLHKTVFADPVPVHTTYFTTIVDAGGKLKVYPDFYGHDRRMAGALYRKASLFPAPRYKASRRYKRKERPVQKKKDWRDEIGVGF